MASSPGLTRQLPNFYQKQGNTCSKRRFEREKVKWWFHLFFPKKQLNFKLFLLSKSSKKTKDRLWIYGEMGTEKGYFLILMIVRWDVLCPHATSPKRELRLRSFLKWHIFIFFRATVPGLAFSLIPNEAVGTSAYFMVARKVLRLFQMRLTRRENECGRSSEITTGQG